MLKYYRVYVKTYRKNELMGTDSYDLIEEEGKLIEEKEIKVTWDNLSDIYEELGVFPPFELYRFKKGRLISFFNFSLFKKITWDIREWKYPDPNLTIKLEVKEKKVSISEILKWHNADEAIQYLTERGLSVFSEIKNGD